MMVGELMQRHINLNAHVAMEQTEYQRQFDEYVARYDAARQRIVDIGSAKAAMMAKRRKIMQYLDMFQGQTLICEFDKTLRFGMVEQVRI